jgi:ankyrin repeat protein
MPSNDDWYEQERLHRAADEGDLLEMKKLVSIGLDVNLFDDLARTPLHYAVQAGHYKAAQWLLDNKAGVNANDEKKIGETPLCFAVQGDYPEMVELLLQQGADPDITGWMGLSARMRAQNRTGILRQQLIALIDRYKPSK